ncbi:hypothetical protein BMS3Abin03_02125 [bacterium BMS3Abin03]|nr:hypothetical protein BMS3Abin03_02125 [bacterium BMS3Abin03]
MDLLNNKSSCLWYQIDYNLKDVNIVVDNRSRVMRDSLVLHENSPCHTQIHLNILTCRKTKYFTGLSR